MNLFQIGFVKISLSLYSQVFTVIATYMPLTNPHNIDNKIQFYEQLQNQLIMFQKKKLFVYTCMWRLERKTWKIKPTRNSWKLIRAKNGIKLIISFAGHNNAIKTQIATFTQLPNVGQTIQ